MIIGLFRALSMPSPRRAAPASQAAGCCQEKPVGTSVHEAILRAADGLANNGAA